MATCLALGKCLRANLIPKALTGLCKGAYFSQTPRLHGLIFTGGIGENASLIRERVLSPLKHLGFHLDSRRNQERSSEPCQVLHQQGPAIFVIKSNEELLMAEKLLGLLGNLGST